MVERLRIALLASSSTAWTQNDVMRDVTTEGGRSSRFL